MGSLCCVKEYIYTLDYYWLVLTNCFILFFQKESVFRVFMDMEKSPVSKG